MGACYWARIDKVFYATTAKDVKVSCAEAYMCILPQGSALFNGNILLQGRALITVLTVTGCEKTATSP
jgi:tRNA(Arg) A34 adenosine deaminase TadA